MTQSPNRHALFQQIQQDQEELRRLLGEVRQALSQKRATVAELAKTLADQLHAHFDEEEATGIFSEVASRAPRLADRAGALRGEHERLRQAVLAFSQAAQGGDGGADWWEQLERAFRDFSQDLMRHEHEENELVQVAYDQDLGAGD